MNHQPFEDWLFYEESLTPEENNELKHHLENCDHCRKLQDSWLGVVNLFNDVPEVGPTPNFVSKWQERLIFERQMDMVVRNRWQSMIMLILIGNVLAGLVFLLSTQFFTSFDISVSLILTGINRLVSILTFFNAAQNLFLTLVRTISSIVPPALWAILGFGLLGACVIWFVSIASLTVIKRRT
jgi:hypothetical protein